MKKRGSMDDSRRRQRGITVIEMVISMLLIYFIFVILGDTLDSSMRNFKQSTENYEIDDNLTSGMNVMINDIRQAAPLPASDATQTGTLSYHTPSAFITPDSLTQWSNVIEFWQPEDPQGGYLSSPTFKKIRYEVIGADIGKGLAGDLHRFITSSSGVQSDQLIAKGILELVVEHDLTTMGNIDPATGVWNGDLPYYNPDTFSLTVKFMKRNGVVFSFTSSVTVRAQTAQ